MMTSFSNCTFLLFAVVVVAVAACVSTCAAATTATAGTAVSHHWVFQTNASIVYSHMSMIEALPDGTLVAAFQGSSLSEGCNDQAIFFTSSKDGGVTWAPAVVAQNDTLALWGPVLRFDKATNKLWLFFSASTKYQNRDKPGCGSFKRSYPGGEVRYVTSTDGGATWTNPVVILPFEARGQVSKVTANHMIITATGRWMLPFWQEPRTVYDKGLSASGVLVSDDNGTTWTTRGSIHNNSTWLIENTLHQFQDSSLIQLFRTQAGYIYESWSTDNGNTWTTAMPSSLLNPNSKVCLTRGSVNGSAILAYNPSKTARTPLVLAQSSLTGHTWTTTASLDNDPNMSFEYPTPLLHAGRVFTTYSANSSKGIKLAISPISS
ncbi:hypothetical protein PTSG_00864 [Salpingoeca rosetta]|uniref:Sialidase domain-containing protein n=1 Tax=Salpingoeca rosetta (strain ATCC 50818 / BSB-021) TaxID=946362 RepID=F2TXP8_SALR5|nr:uncharacterized protein PTSG_00864 [Salpingoeca rosetta]EGD76157.1 hypothetical protein PTSG_00864 [Salpingoeca rosetta]|eukprot:XP_004998332.1 hypothetical protein PTSG_00864 [Salpingoeca rosetta]